MSMAMAKIGTKAQGNLKRFWISTLSNLLCVASTRKSTNFCDLKFSRSMLQKLLGINIFMHVQYNMLVGYAYSHAMTTLVAKNTFCK